MNQDISQYSNIGYTGVGYLVVRVTTASAALPLEDALVTVFGDRPDFSSVIAQLKTGADGLTPKIALSAPPRTLSEVPGNGETAYATYNITVNERGFYPLRIQHVPIFDGITSVQPANLIPLLENGYPDSFDPFTETVVEGETLGNL